METETNPDEPEEKDNSSPEPNSSDQEAEMDLDDAIDIEDDERPVVQECRDPARIELYQSIPHYDTSPTRQWADSFREACLRAAWILRNEYLSPQRHHWPKNTNFNLYFMPAFVTENMTSIGHRPYSQLHDAIVIAAYALSKLIPDPPKEGFSLPSFKEPVSDGVRTATELWEEVTSQRRLFTKMRKESDGRIYQYSSADVDGSCEFYRERYNYLKAGIDGIRLAHAQRVFEEAADAMHIVDINKEEKPIWKPTLFDDKHLQGRALSYQIPEHTTVTWDDLFEREQQIMQILVDEDSARPRAEIEARCNTQFGRRTTKNQDPHSYASLANQLARMVGLGILTTVGTGYRIVAWPINIPPEYKEAYYAARSKSDLKPNNTSAE